MTIQSLLASTAMLLSGPWTGSGTMSSDQNPQSAHCSEIRLSIAASPSAPQGTFSIPQIFAHCGSLKLKIRPIELAMDQDGALYRDGEQIGEAGEQGFAFMLPDPKLNVAVTGSINEQDHLEFTLQLEEAGRSSQIQGELVRGKPVF